MSLFYKVPLVNTHWGWREHVDVLAGLSLSWLPAVDRRKELTAWFQTNFGSRALLVNSGRAALLIALRRLRQMAALNGRNEIAVPSLICPCVPQKIRAAGFQPVFYDVGSDLSPCQQDAIRAAGSDAAAILFPYLYGKVNDPKTLAEHCRMHHQFLIEDCATSFLLSNSQGVLTGAYGDYAIFSFAQGKTINAGGGGVLLDRTPANAEEADAALPPTEWTMLWRAKAFFVAHYVQPRLGYLFPRSPGQSTLAKLGEELHPMAAVDARLILTQFNEWNWIQARKQEALARYAANLSDYPELTLPQYTPGVHLNRLFVQFPGKVLDRPTCSVQSAPLVAFLRKRGIQVQAPYFPAHLSPEFVGCGHTDLYWTEQLYDSLIEVPSQPGLKDCQIDYVCESLVAALRSVRPGALREPPVARVLSPPNICLTS